ncbi:hypothetical protein V6Z12_D10G176700 [Gossypium hirsutum]
MNEAKSNIRLLNQGIIFYVEEYYRLSFLQRCQWSVWTIGMVLTFGPQPESLKLHWYAKLSSNLFLHIESKKGKQTFGKEKINFFLHKKDSRLHGLQERKTKYL